MIINEQGTFYVEGEYAQGDTILKAGDWELRANGSKNAFAYSPETFVRRNLLNWSEDFTKNTSGAGTTTAYGFPDSDGGNRATKITFSGASQIFSINKLIQNLTGSGVSSVLMIKGISGETIRYTHLGIEPQITLTGDWQELRYTNFNATNNNLRLNTYGGATAREIYIHYGQFEQAATPSDYQRTTTHVPRPYAIKDELVTNGTFDTDTSGWTNANTWWSVVDGRAYHPSSASFNPLLQSTSALTDNLSYVIKFDYEVLSGVGKIVTRSSGGSVVAQQLLAVGSGTVEFYFTKTSSVVDFGFFRDGAAATEFYIDNVSVKEVQQPLTLGNGKHKDFRYYPKTLSQNETEALTA